jgi:hypothetical protein
VTWRVGINVTLHLYSKKNNFSNKNRQTLLNFLFFGIKEMGKR